ncbi:hypothetical protein PIB30_087014 [Stylosanthes scabra]|uniref:Uncharacterized protein n=1 Tax=Stylosanthes scabra TaxID=79078 RepID=A0ABU6YTM5_9FABA|nr:hypothetical protein [Stylosanthes scabra]
MKVASAVLPSCDRHTTILASPLQPDTNPSAQATYLSASCCQGPVRQFVARLHACRPSLPPCPSSIVRLPSCLLVAGIVASSPSYSARSVVEENSLRNMSRCPSQIVVGYIQMDSLERGRDSQQIAEDNLEEYEAFGAYTHYSNGVQISCYAA